jgi:regulator of protease activity HflC (stomatin/prohibitin superfamily)
MGEGALAWVGQIANWIGAWIPTWRVLDTTEGAIKFEGFFLPAPCRRYKAPLRITVCGPGVHWFWPAFSSFQHYPTAIQTDDLPTQTMESADGVSFIAGGMVTYSVPDLEKLLTQTHSAMKMIQVLTLAAIHDVCCRMPWEALVDEQRKGTLDTKLRNAAQKFLTRYGVKVEACMLTDLARSRVFRLIQSQQQDASLTASA